MKSQWEIGDALLHGMKRMHPIAKNYDDKYLTEMERTARVFPSSRRYQGVSWKTHASARSPDVLDKIVELAKTRGLTKLNLKFVRQNLGWARQQIAAQESAALVLEPHSIQVQAPATDRRTKSFRILALLREASPELQERILTMLLAENRGNGAKR